MLFAVFYLLLRRLVALEAALPRIGTTTSRSWSFVISSLYSSAMLAGRAFAAAIGCSWLRSAGCSRARVGHRSWSVRRLSFAGTVSWSAGSGPILAGPPAGGRRSQTMCEISSFGWQGEPPVGMRADQGRAGQARYPGLGLGDPGAPSTKWTRAGTTTRRPHLERLPQLPGSGDSGVRLLHFSVMIASPGGLAHFFTARS